MCTVTFIASIDGFYLTSNRDERQSRDTLPPFKHKVNGKTLYFPQDKVGGGTWIACDAQGRTACLLNGAFVNHRKETSYRKSRGLILLESFDYADISEFVDKTKLENIEPFTLLSIDFSKHNLKRFNEFRWDGEKKHLKALSLVEPQIWSSATLYPPEVQVSRQELFNEWIEKYKQFDDKMILNFHNRRHGLYPTDDILMQGYMDLKTVSISQVHVQQNNFRFKYLDLEDGKTHTVSVNDNKFENVK